MSLRTKLYSLGLSAMSVTAACSATEETASNDKILAVQEALIAATCPPELTTAAAGFAGIFGPGKLPASAVEDNRITRPFLISVNARMEGEVRSVLESSGVAIDVPLIDAANNDLISYTVAPGNLGGTQIYTVAAPLVIGADRGSRDVAEWSYVHDPESQSLRLVSTAVHTLGDNPRTKLCLGAPKGLDLKKLFHDFFLAEVASVLRQAGLPVNGNKNLSPEQQEAQRNAYRDASHRVTEKLRALLGDNLRPEFPALFATFHCKGDTSNPNASCTDVTQETVAVRFGANLFAEFSSYGPETPIELTLGYVGHKWAGSVPKSVIRDGAITQYEEPPVETVADPGASTASVAIGPGQPAATGGTQFVAQLTGLPVGTKVITVNSDDGRFLYQTADGVEVHEAQFNITQVASSGATSEQQVSFRVMDLSTTRVLRIVGTTHLGGTPTFSLRVGLNAQGLTAIPEAQPSPSTMPAGGGTPAASMPTTF